MRISLINPKSSFPKEAEATVSPGKGRVWQPLDMAFIAAKLEKEGVDVQFIDAAALNIDIPKIKKLVFKFKPQKTVITSTIMDMWRCAPMGYENMALVLKAMPKDTTTIIYGPHVSAFPEKIFSELKPSYAVIGEPEERVPELILGGHKKLDGVVYEENKKIIVKEPRGFVKMEKLPLPSYHLLPMDKYRCDPSFPTLQKTPFAATITARGCPYNCTFCYKEMVSQNYRTRTLDKLEQEFELLEKRYKVKSLYFLDEIFNLQEDRTRELCEILKHYKFKWGCQIRPDILNNMAEMKKAGCVLVDLGVESINDNILKKINKRFSSQQVIKAVDFLNKEKIPFRLFMIMGLPGETQQSIKESVDFYVKSGAISGGFPLATVYPKTALWELAIKEGKIKGDGWDELPGASGIVGNKFSRKQILKLQEEANAKTLNYASLIRNTSKIELIKGAIRKPRLALKIFLGMIKRALARAS